MGAPFLRNDLLACAGVTAFVCAVAFLIWPHAANSDPPRPAAVVPSGATAANTAGARATSPGNPGVASSAVIAEHAATPVPAHKPSAYGEAFIPPPPAATHPELAESDAADPVGTGASGGQPFHSVAPGVMAANLISAPAPGYPLLARIAHVRGEVTVEAVIASNGSVSSARAIQGHRLLRSAAVAAVRRQRYRPYRVDGQPADVSTVVTVDFGAPS